LVCSSVKVDVVERFEVERLRRCVVYICCCVWDWEEDWLGDCSVLDVDADWLCLDLRDLKSPILLLILLRISAWRLGGVYTALVWQAVDWSVIAAGLYVGRMSTTHPHPHINFPRHVFPFPRVYKTSRSSPKRCELLRVLAFT